MRWHGQGHRAFKLKVQPGLGRRAGAGRAQGVGDDVALLVDANGSFRSDNADDMATSAGWPAPTWAWRPSSSPSPPTTWWATPGWPASIDVPVCLDESIGSLGDLDTALALGACGAVSLKAGRVGGLVEARRIHQRCRDAGVSLRCGGMLETGLGRARQPGRRRPAGLHPAARPGAVVPLLRDDLTAPFDRGVAR